MRSELTVRQEITLRNLERAHSHEHELSYGEVPSVIYQGSDAKHGNFLPESYRAIQNNPNWTQRLKKAYTGSRWVPRSGERKRFELDCANSSDALLMNVFCYPRVLLRLDLCALLGVERGLQPVFGFRPGARLRNGKADRTEIDMRLGNLLIETKLTESGFQTAPLRLIERYRDLNQVFDITDLPIRNEIVSGYQLIRSVLAAYASDCSFALLCDSRRVDLIESWATVMRAVRSYSFRSQLKVITWQEISATLPRKLQKFLKDKYGIVCPQNLSSRA